MPLQTLALILTCVILASGLTIWAVAALSIPIYAVLPIALIASVVLRAIIVRKQHR